MSKLPGITHLYLPYNNISGSVPGSLTNCTNLRVLDLSSNEFTGEVPSGFPVLEKLLIASNYLSGTVPVELGKCTSLETIDLSFNALNRSDSKGDMEFAEPLRLSYVGERSNRWNPWEHLC